MKRALSIVFLLVASTLVQSVHASAPPEQSVLVYFDYGKITTEQIDALGKKLSAGVASARLGTYEGYELSMCGTMGTFILHGPDADKLLAAVKHLLEDQTFLKGAKVTLKYGRIKGRDREVDVTL